MQNKLLLLLIFIGLFACTSGHTKTKAFVKQRKIYSGDSLQLHFDFEHDGKLVSDSIVISNTILVQDSVWVTYPKNEPQKVTVLLP